LFIDIAHIMKKPTFTLLKFLSVTFRATAFLVGIGIIGTLVMFPYATRMVEHRAVNLGLFVVDGAPAFSFTHGSSGFSWSTMDHQGPALQPGLRYPAELLSGSPLGRITFGRFSLRNNDGARQIEMAKKDGSVAVMDALEGSFTFAGTTNASEILAPVKWPFIVSILCTGVFTIAVLELLSRMFDRVQSGEVFTQTTVRYAQVIGILFIASSLLKGFTAAWLKHAMAVVVMQQVAPGALYLDSSARGDSSGLVTGLVILALAEVFRHGLKLKEENALTI